jgi:hypothetical protein
VATKAISQVAGSGRRLWLGGGTVRWRRRGVHVRVAGDFRLRSVGSRAIVIRQLGRAVAARLAEGPKRRTRGGIEWKPIKILLEGDGYSNKTNTASNTRLRLTTQVGQVHTATGVLLNLGTNFQPHRPENAAEHQNSSPLTNTGQTDEHHRLDRFLLVELGNFHRMAPHRSGRWDTPVIPVSARKPQNTRQAYQAPN